MIGKAMRTNAGLGIALGVAAAVVGWIGLGIWKDPTPGTDWIEIADLRIEDTLPGGDPRITYSRAIKADVYGVWTVNVFRHADGKDRIGTIYCWGTGAAAYQAGHELPPDATHLSWLVGPNGKPCHFGNGIYRAVVTIELKPEGYPVKVVTKESNYFLVPPR
jgi:hypothetical protein